MSALYKLTNGSSVLKLVDGAYRMAIPFDNLNRDYQEYLAWITKGNAPEAADEEVEEIKYISKLTIMDRLEALGLQTAAVTALNSDAVKLARWNAATEIAIDDADVIAVLTAIGITDTSTVLY